MKKIKIKEITNKSIIGFEVHFVRGYITYVHSHDGRNFGALGNNHSNTVPMTVFGGETFKSVKDTARYVRREWSADKKVKFIEFDTPSELFIWLANKQKTIEDKQMTVIETFLRKKKLFTKFKDEYISLRQFPYPFSKFMDRNGDSPNGLVCAFQWGRTKDGLSFWYKVDKEFNVFFNKTSAH